MLYVPVAFLLCCTFTSLVQSAMGCMAAVQAYGFFGTIPATATTAAVSVAATKAWLVFAVLLMVLGLIVAVNCLKEFFGKEAVHHARRGARVVRDGQGRVWPRCCCRGSCRRRGRKA